MGDLKVGVAVANKASGALTEKHYIDASTDKSQVGGDNAVPLADKNGNPVTFEGKQVYITPKGQELLNKWNGEGLGIQDQVVYQENWKTSISDWFWGNPEEDR